MSRKHLQELIEYLQEFYKCPSCDTSYYLDDIKVLGEMNDHYFVQLSCHECSLPALAMVPPTGSKPRKKKTDLSVSEEAKFMSMGAISAEEIAEFHRYITSGGLK